MRELILLTLLLTIFTWFLHFIVKRVGILPSISDSFYSLEKYHKWYGSLFCFVLLAMGILVMFIAPTSPFAIIMFGGAIFTAGSPFFDTGGANKFLHFLGAVTLITAGFGHLWWTYSFWHLIIVMVIGSIGIIVTDTKNSIWWIEILGFYLIISGWIIVEIAINL